ncbi:MAG TPA: hypothetical protein VFL67_18625, partial [Mycobacterium sp.]|nr:hypothetical protein [Mycobacterium sp.]
MAAVNLTTDSNEHGQLTSGWSQEEDASPHVIGDNSGETRQTSFSAIAKGDSDLMVGKSIATTGPFDSTGTMLETTLVGDVVTTSSY